MKYLFKYISILLATAVIASCSTDEHMPEFKKNKTIEFVVRPTSFTGYNVATKSTRALSETSLTDTEKKIVSAYFLVYDANGNRVAFEKLSVTNNNIGSKTLLSDQGESKVTVCFLANVPYSYANSLVNLNDISTKPLPLTYASSDDTGYVGIPCLNLDTNGDGTDDAATLCFPMFGMTTCSLTAELENNQIIVPLKRLFAKVYLEMNMDLTDKPTSSQSAPYFKISSYSLKNLPKNVILDEAKKIDEENNITLTESPWVNKTDEESDENGSSYFEQDITTSLADGAVILYDADDNANQSKPLKFAFYTPEYSVLPEQSKVDMYKELSSAEQQRYKPILFAEGKRPLLLTINGIFRTPNQEEILLEYRVYLGENAFDNFSIFRNNKYNNYLTIKGTNDAVFESDHRVEVKYDGFMVGFQRATLLDSHYEVRPLRLMFEESFLTDIQEQRLGHGTVRVELFEIDANGNLTNSAPDWAALERLVTVPDGSSAYCKGASSTNTAYPTKRRYFTTSLVSDLIAQTGSNSKNAGSYIEFSTDTGDESDTYQENFNINGNTIIWLYVDEYSANSDNDYSAEEADVRHAQMNVTFTVTGETEGITKTYRFSQRPIYPIRSSKSLIGNATEKNRRNYYGIEFFEEYLHSFDASDNYGEGDGTAGGDYNIGQTIQGLQWGLNGITLSRNKKALFVTDVEPYVDPSSDPKATEGVSNFLGLLGGIYDNIMTERVQSLPAYYDFYTSDDVSTNLTDGWLTESDARDFQGYEMNIEIIDQLLEQDNTSDNILLNQLPLNEIDPKSVIAYCYNKNKRDADGNVVTRNSDGSLNISNMRWYAPSIKELEEIISTAYDLEPEFNVFTTDFYWSCQPAYTKNQVEVEYRASAVWRDQDNVGSFFRPSYVYTDRPLVMVVSGSGPYLQDDINRARATKFVENQAISSSVNGISNKLSAYGSNNFGSHTDLSYATFSLWLTGQINRTTPIWNPANPIPTPTGETLTYHEGNKLRVPESDMTDDEIKKEILHRVRCIYNPNPPAKVTRISNGEDGYKYNFTN